MIATVFSPKVLRAALPALSLAWFTDDLAERVVPSVTSREW